MKTIKNTIGNEVKVFAETFEHEAYDQIKRLANFEAYHQQQIRVMPDAHAGKGCVVGTTMTIADKITPNLVGVDIGCGMSWFELKNKENDFAYEFLDQVIRQTIPHGFGVHGRPVAIYKSLSELKCKKHVDLDRAACSIGTLGGGNHFIELGISEKTGNLFLIIHSGSRKLGGDICKYYQDKAFQNVNEMVKVKNNLVKKLKAEGRHKEIDVEMKKLQKPAADKELAFLHGEDFHDYMHDMAIAQKFASANRETMAEIIISGLNLRVKERFETIHNYIDFKRMILRKGAVRAEENELILIPINMRDGSLICRGKGNEDWNYSAPHGAGRLMSRTAAKANISMEEFKDSMKDIFSTSVVPETIDEAPHAYKPIEEIKRLITDTAEVVDTIRPLYNFKASN